MAVPDAEFVPLQVAPDGLVTTPLAATVSKLNPVAPLEMVMVVNSVAPPIEASAVAGSVPA